MIKKGKHIFAQNPLKAKIPVGDNKFGNHEKVPNLRGNHEGSYSDSSGFEIVKLRNHMVDFAAFPIINFILDKTGLYPSSIQITARFNYIDFVKRCLKISKGDIVRSTRFSEKEIVFHDFICFYEKKYKIALYINIEQSREDGASNIDINCLHTSNKSPNEIVSIVKNEIFKLTEVENKSNESGKVYLLVHDGNSLRLQKHILECPKIDFDINYNDGFKNISDMLLSKLCVNKSKGLFLLHGKPGMGKTTYIRYLINNIENKKVIYIPPNMINMISDPAMIQFLSDQTNSILVIEDAENILYQRNINGSGQAVANLLNLTDGLLSDCLNIQVVATFNTDVVNIDKALLRKGRLMMKYEFKDLEPSRSKKLCDKLKVHVSDSTSLAEIYNAGEMSFEVKKTRIGFR